MPFCFKNIKWPFVVFIITLLIVVGGFLIPAGNRLSKIQIAESQSDMHLRAISRLVLSHEKEHGGIVPKNMGELIPDGRMDLLSLFYAPNADKSQKPTDRLTNKALLDEYSDYALASDSNTNIVAFEKPGLWSDGSVAVCFRDLTVQRMNVSRFKVLLK